MTWIKRIAILLTWALVLIGGSFALISSQSLRESRPLISYEIHIQCPENQAFLIEEDLKEIEKKMKHIIKKNVVLETFNKQDKNSRLLTYKVLLEKFNDKYSDLQDNQKTLLKEYVNSVTNSPALKSYINQEIKEVKKDLTKYSKKIEDKAVAVKLNETKGMIKPLCKKSFVNDDNVINLLNYYELVNELKTIHG